MEPAYFMRPSASCSPPPRKKSSKKLFYTAAFLILITAIVVGGYLIYNEFTSRSLSYKLDCQNTTKSSMGTAEKWSNINNHTENSVQSVVGKSMPSNQSELSSTTESTPSSSLTPAKIGNEVKINSDSPAPTYPQPENPRIYEIKEFFALCPVNSTAPEAHLSGKSDNITRLLKTKHSDGYKWIKYDPKTFDRSKAYKIGVSFEGHDIYLGRGNLCGDLVIANVDHDKNKAIVTYYHKTFAITDFEVFIAADLRIGRRISEPSNYTKVQPDQRNRSATEFAPSSTSSPVIRNQTERPRIHNEKELLAMCPQNSTASELHLSDKSDNVTRFLQTTHSNDYTWVKYDPKTFDPSKAFAVGMNFQGHQIYLGRGIVCGDLVPANVDHDNNKAIVTYHFKTFAISDFEVFIPADVTLHKRIRIIQEHGGAYPTDAIPIGITKRGQKLFTGFPLEPEPRFFDFPIGKIHPANKVCYYPTRSKETSSWSYKVFALNSSGSSERERSDIPPPSYPPPKVPLRSEKLLDLCPANSIGSGLRLHSTSENVSRFIETTHSDDYKWVKYDPKTFDPSKAYKAGINYQGHAIYFGRGIVCGDLVPANVDHENHTATVTYHYKTFTITDFEVFIFTGRNRGKQISHKRGSGGDSPTNAILVGITRTGQTLYFGEPVGRREKSSDFPIGKVHPAKGVCYYPTASLGERYTFEYEIFVIEGGTSKDRMTKEKAF